MDLNSLIAEAQELLTSISEILTSTMSQGVEVVKNYEELAGSKVAEIVNDRKRELADLSTYSESVKSCVEKRQHDFRKVEEKLRKELAACYTKHYESLDKMSLNKAAIRDEAQQIKDELQQAITNCMSSANKTECFTGVLNSLKKRVKTISSRAGEALKKEAQARVKSTKAVFDCDKKAMEDAQKRCSAIVNEVRQCTAEQD